MEWKKVRIDEVASFNDQQLSSKDEWSTKIYLDTGSITSNTIREYQIISNESELPSRAKRLVKHEDIIYSTVRPNQKHYGLIVNPQSNLIVSTGFAVIRAKKEYIDAKYLYYYITQNDITEYLQAIGEQAVCAYPSIKADDIAALQISLPDLPTQRRISSILSSLDAKIETNRKINEKLEAMAQALFKSWFIDFEPFKGGKFVESELGMIPEGYKISTIGEISHVLETGKRPKGGVNGIETGVPSIGAESVKGVGYYDYTKTKYVTKEFASTLKKGKINDYDLLIYKDGGKPGYFIPNFGMYGEGFPFDGDMFLNEHVFKLDLESIEYNIFAYFYMQTEYVMATLNAVGGKAAIPGINQKNIEDLIIPTNDNLLVIEFGERVFPIMKQILINSKESTRLANLRDTLLPKLMSGEMEV